VSSTTVRVENISKRFRLGVIGRETLQEELLYWWHKLRGRNPSDHMGEISSGGLGPVGETGKPSDKNFWALRDVSFEAREGEVLGIIGRNGAGKSSLLKILARITAPTSGEAEIEGRVASLLEVGTGFHPELTGRENVYLNGTLLGMKKVEIDRKFDEIVAFSELEKYLDTPVKRYSSGMAVRLAFAVAAHLDAEVLLIDEVLAVGDASFRRNCLAKMGDVAESGRTILFVSHQMNAINSLCTRCLWLDQGRVVGEGEPDTVISQYLSANVWEGEWNAETAAERFPNQYFEPSRFCVVDESMQPLKRDIRADETFGVVVEGEAARRSKALSVGFQLYSASGISVFVTQHTDTEEERWPEIATGRNSLVVWIPPHTLNEGFYRAELMIRHRGGLGWISRPGRNAPSLSFHISGGLSKSPVWIRKRSGVTAPILPFHRV